MKFLHCADIHLDSPFSLALPADAGKRRTELRSDFSSAVLYAKTEGCKLFLIAGDLFDDDFVTKDTMKCLSMNFRRFHPVSLSSRPAITTPFVSVLPISSPNGRKTCIFLNRRKWDISIFPKAMCASGVTLSHPIPSPRRRLPVFISRRIPTERSIFSLPCRPRRTAFTLCTAFRKRA